jgi:type VI secretion system protein ImpG
LALHAIPGDPDAGRKLSNLKRVGAVQEIRQSRVDYFVGGRPIRGTRVEVEADPGGFASRGDLMLFGDILDLFFGHFHYLNTFSKLVIIESDTREEMSWAPRLGTRRLI